MTYGLRTSPAGLDSEAIEPAPSADLGTGSRTIDLRVMTRPSPPGRRLIDSAVLARRGVRLTMRRPDAMLTALLLPVILIVDFRYLLGGAMHVGVAYIVYVVPGVFLAAAALGSSTTAVSVADDMTRGTIDRFRSLDIGGGSFLVGHVAASVVRNAASMALVVAVAFPLGFRSHAELSAWAGAAGIVMLVILAISAMAVVVGLLVKSTEAASGFTFLMLFLPFTSSGFVPVSTMPTWLREFAAHQPATSAIEAVRSLLTGTSLGWHAWTAVAWWGGILLVSAAASARLFQSRIK